MINSYDCNRPAKVQLNKAADVSCLHLCGPELRLKAQRFCSTACEAAWSAYSEVLVPDVKIRTLATWKLIRQLDGETVNLMQPDDLKQILLPSKFSSLVPPFFWSKLSDGRKGEGKV